MPQLANRGVELVHRGAETIANPGVRRHGCEGLQAQPVRLDLESSAVTPYFARPGMVSYVLGLGPGGVPVLKVYNSTTYEVWLPGFSPVRLAGGKMGQFWVNSVLGDTHGTWLATRTGLYLYTASKGLEFASPVTGYLASPCR